MDKNEITIRPLSEEQTAAAAELERRCFSQPWSQPSLLEAISQEQCWFVSAVSVSGTLVGCAGMHMICGECYIDTVAVHPDWRGRGIGRALMKALIQRAERINAAFLSLEVRPSNASAVWLYRTMGFEYVGTRRNFYEEPKEDAAIYTRWLTAE